MADHRNARRERRREKLERALHERLQRVEAEVTRKLVEVRDGERERVDTADGEWASCTADNDVLILNVIVQTRNQIHQALTRLKAGRFGRCHSCGRDIPVKRLESLPFALRCRPCQEAKEATHTPRGGHRSEQSRDFEY